MNNLQPLNYRKSHCYLTLVQTQAISWIGLIWELFEFDVILALEWIMAMALIYASVCYDVSVQVILGDLGFVATSLLG